MGTYSWSDSLVPLFESEKILLEQLLDHSIEEVRQWAMKNISLLENQIKREKNEDAERFL